MSEKHQNYSRVYLPYLLEIVDGFHLPQVKSLSIHKSDTQPY